MTTLHTSGPLTWRYQGEANEYYLMNGKHWVANIKQNGEMLLARQEANMRLWSAAPELLAALRKLQANPNDPRAHRVALDAIALATSTD
jgi:hypothetical protein